MLATRMRMAAAGAGGFNPLTAISWYAAYWADDPDWTNPGDGNAVSSWRDGSGNGRTASQGTGSLQPVFRSSVAALNSRAGVDFAAGDPNDYLDASYGATLSQPVSHVVVVNVQSVPGSGSPFLTDAASGNRQAVLFDKAAGGQWEIFAGASLRRGSAAATGAQCVEGFFNGGSSLIRLNGTQLGTTGNAGSNSATTLRIGARISLANTTIDGDIAFIGVYSGTFSSHAAYSDFKNWVKSYYGITMA